MSEPGTDEAAAGRGLGDGEPVDEDLLDLVSQIASSVYGGSTIAAVRRQLSRYIPADVVDRALAIYERRTGRIRDLRDPRSLVADQQRTGRWYIGPRPEDLFWPALCENLRTTGLDDHAIRSIDKSSTKIVSLLPRPGEDAFSSRGLVLGYVQSGKTTSFMSVAAKLCDVRYRLVVVLSGITDNLRSQTQQRLERMLVGDARDRWHLLTGWESDFDAPARNAANLLSNPDQRLLAVVKKNPYRLRRLARFLDAAGTVLEECTILVIDDEADQASIDVGRQGRQSKINALIRRILSKPKVAYVAYTATPFANMLIDPSVPDDLYPADFIVDLPRPENYFGAERIFGRDLLAHEDGSVDDGLDVIRIVEDDEVASVQPPRGRAGIHTWEPQVTPSLAAAIRWFILATAARRCRDGVAKDSTMLVHTSMRAAAHTLLAERIAAYLSHLRTDYERGGPTCRQLQQEWADETARVPATALGLRPVSWEELAGHLPRVLTEVGTVVDNYQSPVRLVYGSDPVTAVAIGGNTLSRGLTLEGLVCSYFVRAASAYDTLLQMGRWFGYRRGYEDLPRIWMTSELASWFIDLATVEAEIRQQIRRYEDEHLTPRQLAVKIRTHPAMAVTSAAKMRAGITVAHSYGTQVMQTIRFNHHDEAWLRNNTAAADDLLLRAMATPSVTEVPVRAGRTALHGVPADEVIRFLQRYRFHHRSPSLRAEALCEYISRQNMHGALRTWNIVVIEQERDRLGTMQLGGRKVNLINRSRLDLPEDFADIKALVSTSDRVADLPEELAHIRSQLGLAATDKLTDERLRVFREGQLGPVGLLCLYPISRNSDDHGRGSGIRRTTLDAVLDVVGVGLFFPESWGPEDQTYVTVDLSTVTPVDEEAETLDIDELDQADEAAGEAAVRPAPIENAPTARTDGRTARTDADTGTGGGADG